MGAPVPPRIGVTTDPHSSTIPAEVLQKAGPRYTAVAALCAFMSLMLHVLVQMANVDVASQIADKPAVMEAASWTIVGLSIALILANRSGRLSPTALLYAGMSYQVVVAFGLSVIAFFERTVSRVPDGSPSWTATWIAVCGLAVPNTLRRSLMVNVLSAAMEPLAFGLTMAITGDPLPNGFALAITLLPTFLVAGWTTILNGRMFEMARQVERAKEMGSYRLEELIGKGGMGEVWRASHRLLARDAAVKLIRPDVLLAQPGREAAVAQRRFEQEARATASLKSPHTVELYDFGVTPDGNFYYVMELLVGVDLDSLVRRYGPVSPSRTVHILQQACRSLAEAHSIGLVHRDLKPTNVCLTKLGLDYDFVKVLDFGLVKRQAVDGESRMTMDGTTAGTPAYMAPEIAAGDAVDGRADLYAVGCIGYWLLTAQVVFNERTPMATIMAHMQKQPDPPSTRTEIPIPAEFDALILRCLAKSPADRFQSALELHEALSTIPLPPWTPAQAQDWWSVNRPSTSRNMGTTATGETEPLPVTA
ncbi:MAG TPA: serine/threonine-protein kinase [Bryobacteraceae bacterium]|nr:serine/threonine-protein kinase [Bryobacteraceae bacterium]